MPLLAITVPGSIQTDGDHLRMASKTYSGIVEFSRAWPGDVVHVTHATTIDSSASGLGMISFHAADAPYHTVVASDRLNALRRLRPDAILANLSKSELPILEKAPAPTVAVTENDLRNRLRWAQIATSSIGALSRQAVGLTRLELRYRRALKHSAGIQANGPIAHHAYGGFAPSVMYYDARVRQAQVWREDDRKSSDRPFTFAFSGRWLEQKGALDAVHSFQRAAFRTPVRLQIIGGGPLADSLYAAAAEDERIQVLGNLDFESEWLPHVRKEVDVMLLPHRQADPAGTFLEGAGAGAPFLSYATRHSQHLSSRGLGWTVPLGNVDALAKQLERLPDSLDDVFAMRRKAAQFMQCHSMENEFAMRAEHLAQCVTSKP